MAKFIHTIYWSKIDSKKLEDPVLLEENFNLYFIMPVPNNHDSCFFEAGFNEFENSDEKWDKEFDEIVEIIIKKLKRFGNKTSIEKIKKEINKALYYDNYPCPITKFGENSLTIGEGHYAFWIITNNEEIIENILKKIGNERKVKKKKLNWNIIIPRVLYKKSENNSKIFSFLEKILTFIK